MLLTETQNFLMRYFFLPESNQLALKEFKASDF